MNILLLIILLMILCHVNGQCLYDTLFDEDISQTDQPNREVKLPFGLVVAYDKRRVNTEQNCIDFCNSKKWCIGVSSLFGTEKEEFFCSFVTSWQAIGFPHNKCTSTLNVLNCELKENMLISLDDEVFIITVLDNAVGGGANDHVIPSHIFEDEHFCHILKTDNEIISTRASVFSDYFTTSPIIFNGIVEVSDVEEEPPSKGDPNIFARRGTSMAHRGNPIVGMEIMDSHSYSGSRPFEDYRLFRNEFLEVHECNVVSNSTYISPEERTDTDSFFHIITTRKDGTQRKYLSCVVTSQDNEFACDWVETPQVVWKMGSWIDPYYTEHGSLIGGHDRAFMAYDINNHDNELGWLGVSNCDETNHHNKDQLRILHGGKKDGESNIHCGVNNWRITRGTYNTIEETGTFFSWKQMKQFGSHIHDLTTFIREAVGQSVNNARGCGGQFFDESPSDYFNCDGTAGERNNMFDFEAVFTSTDTNTLYSIIGIDNTHLYCPRDTKDCIWAAATSDKHKKQFFKFYSYGIGPSTVSSHANAAAANNNIAVYEEIGNFMVVVGYLGIAKEFDNKKTLYLSQTTTNEIREPTGNKVIFTDIKLDNTKIITSIIENIKLVAGDVNSEAILKLTSVNAISPTLVPLNDDGILNDDKYGWIMDAHTKMVDDMMVCDDGDYLHQIHCHSDTKCEHVNIGCVKPKTGCSINIESNTTIVPLSQIQFSRCPYNDVVIGFNSTHIKCKHLDVNTNLPIGHAATSFSSIGFLTETGKFTATKLTKPSSTTFHGSPFQAILVNEKNIQIWGYGVECVVEFDDSNVRVNPEEAIHNAVRFNALNTCDTGKNEFISHMFCTDQTADCRKGISFTCDSAPKCEFMGESVVVNVKSDNLRGIICPFNSVMVGIKCKNEKIPGEPFTGVCDDVEITCMKIKINPGFNPDKPKNNNLKDEKSITTILIGIGIGLPLLVFCAILCLCCLPDDIILSNNIPISEDAKIKDYEMIDYKYDQIRKRRNRF